MIIEPERFYSLKDLLPYFPWIKSLPTFRKWVSADMRGPNTLKAIKVGKGVVTRYHIKGVNAINFRALIEDRGVTLHAMEGGEYTMEPTVDEVNEKIDEAVKEDAKEGQAPVETTEATTESEEVKE